MYRPLAAYIGFRYTRAKRRNHFISFISLISMLGMALGITALITVLSVMNGFQEELRDRILSMTAHVKVSRWGQPVTDWTRVAEQAGAHPSVQAAAPYINAEVMLNDGNLVSGALLQGVLPVAESTTSRIAELLVDGTLEELQPGRYGIILGKVLADSLGLRRGDKVTVITPQVSATAAGVLPRLRRFDVVGIFHAGMFEYDRSLALVHIEDAARLLRVDGVHGVQLRLDDMFRAPRVAQDLDQVLGPQGYWVRDWTREHQSFFRAIQIEKTAMFIIMTLIVAVAAFNIVSTLVMVVTDKQSDIAILRTLGVTPAGIMAVFMVQGITIGVAGTLLGVAGGTALALHVDVVVPFIEGLFGIKFLAPDVYLITDLPSRVLVSDVGVIAAMSFSLAALATIYPAWRAARTQPAQALRHE